MASITLGGTPTKTAGELPAIGSTAHDFTLTGTDMGNISLSDFTGKKVVLNIFPSINTSICAASARKFNEVLNNLENTVVINVSKDLPFSLKAYCASEGLENIKNASEYKNESFSSNYKVKILDGKFEGLFSRCVIVIGEDGKVKYTEQVPEIGQEPNYEAALAAL